MHGCTTRNTLPVFFHGFSCFPPSMSERRRLAKMFIENGAAGIHIEAGSATCWDGECCGGVVEGDTNPPGTNDVDSGSLKMAMSPIHTGGFPLPM